MAHVMNATEILAFLAHDPPRPATLATTRADGRPHVAPVWYAMDDDGSVMFNTGRGTVKGRNLLRRKYAALCVDDDRPPFSFAVLEGPVELSEEAGPLLHWATVIGGRYMGDDLADTYGARNGIPGELLVRLRPSRLLGTRDLAD
jgi:PPOX class probable F420-dependent enzyme